MLAAGAHFFSLLLAPVLAGVTPARSCASSLYDILTLLSLLRELLLMRNYDVRLKVFYTKTPFLTSDEKLGGVLCLQYKCVNVRKMQ